MITNIGRASADAVWEIEDIPYAKVHYFTLSWADQFQEIPADGKNYRYQFNHYMGSFLPEEHLARCAESQLCLFEMKLNTFLVAARSFQLTDLTPGTDYDVQLTLVSSQGNDGGNNEHFTTGRLNYKLFCIFHIKILLWMQ